MTASYSAITGWNTIILRKITAKFTDREFAEYEKYDYILEGDTEELQRWSGGDEGEAEARKALAKVKNEYDHSNDNCWRVTEYALEYCNYDEDGEFVSGSDFLWAKDDPEYPFDSEDAEQLRRWYFRFLPPKKWGTC